MKLEVNLNEQDKQTCDDLGRSSPFAADDLIGMLNDACSPEAPGQVILSKSQVALLVLLSHLGFKMVAAYQTHLLREKGIDPNDNLLIDLLKALALKETLKETKGGSDANETV